MRYHLLHILVVGALLSCSRLLAQGGGIETGVPGYIAVEDLQVDPADDPPLDVRPDTIVFGCVLPGERPAKPFTVINRGDKPVDIDGFRLRSGGPSPFIIPIGRLHLDPGETYTGIVRFDPRSPGIWSADMEIGVSYGGRRPVIHLYGESSKVLQAIPDQYPLLFGSVPVGDTVERCVVITNPACRDLVITDISIDRPPFQLTRSRTFPDTLRAGASDTICVAFSPQSAADESGMLRITALNGSGTDIALSGMGAMPGLVAWPYNLFFNDLPLGDTSRVQRAAVCNRGATDITVDSWQVVGGDSLQFLVDPPPVPALLHANAADTIWFDVRFVPAGSVGVKYAELRINNLTNGPVVFLQGNGIAPAVNASPLSIDMGSVDIGAARTATDTLTVTNASGHPIHIAGISLSGTDPAYFAITGRIPATIDPGSSGRYSVRFAPDSAREYAANGIVLLSSGYTIQVALTGRGLAPDSRRIRVDSTHANVNDIFQLGVRIDPPLTAADNITDYAITFRIDPRALFLHRPVDAGGAATLTYLAADTLRIERHGGSPIIGDMPLQLELEGLVTGKPENFVEIESAALGGRRITTAGSGLVVLAGCDVGRDLGFGSPTKVTSISPSPASTHAVIRYVAPGGTVPSLRVVSLTGETVVSGMLPAGTATEQEAGIELGALRPGFYLLELRVGTQRSSLPILIEK